MSRIWIIWGVLHSLSALAEPCATVVARLAQDPPFAGEASRWAHGQNPTLHHSPEVAAVVEALRPFGIRLEKPAEKIAAFLDYWRLALPTRKADFVDAHVIKTVPPSHFEKLRQRAREQGRGQIALDERAIAETIIRDQRDSLGAWYDYFASLDTAHYPPWQRVLVLHEVARLSKFDVERGKFPKRDKDQIAPFPELNREALALVMAEMSQLRRETFSFANRYAFHLKELAQKQADLTVADGQWVKYPRGSDPAPLVASLKGCNTGWCTAESATARKQLGDGDFHVFYSHDREGRPTVPRLAIRMNGDHIAEVRGVAKNQNVDHVMARAPVLDAKLGEFGNEGARYQKRTRHMAALTAIEAKHKKGDALSQSELRFLYQFDEKIEGFGYQDDPRIAEIIGARDLRADIAGAAGVMPSEVSLTADEAVRSGMRFHWGDLNLAHLEEVDELHLPEVVHGNIDLGKLRSAIKTTWPKVVTGDLNLRRLDSARGMIFPELVGGNLNLYFIGLIKGVTLPRKVTGALYLNSLQTGKGLVLPEVGGAYYGPYPH